MDAETAPFGRRGPGRAPGAAVPDSADRIAVNLAERLVNTPETRLGLIPVARGADIPAYTGWAGAADHLDPGALSAVLRSWEDRFGVRLIRMGSNSLVLSVAVPPTTEAAALPIAVEHFALCRDNVSYGPGALRGYAQELVGVPHWSFWWEPT